jgi:hypothetical protein
MSYSGTINTPDFKVDYDFNSETYQLKLNVTNNGIESPTCLFSNKGGYEMWRTKFHEEHKHLPITMSLTEVERMIYTLGKILDYINKKYNEYTTDYIEYFKELQKQYKEDDTYNPKQSFSAYMTSKAAKIALDCHFPFKRSFKLEQVMHLFIIHK